MRRFSLPRRLAALAFLLVLAGCDSSGPNPEPYRGVIEVGLVYGVESGPALRLAAADDYGCADLLAAETQGAAGHLEVRVVGIVRQTGATCVVSTPTTRLIPLPFEGQGDFPIEVTHAGSADAYVYLAGIGGERLEAVRTSTTRLAEAP